MSVTGLKNLRGLPWRTIQAMSRASQMMAWRPALRAARAYGPHFDPEWYRAQNEDIHLEELDPFVHYLCQGRAEGRTANSSILPGVIARAPTAAFADTLRELVSIIKDSRVFDANWYSARYGVSSMSALEHYIIAGAYEGCDPNPFFCTSLYYATYPDIAQEGLNALSHYIEEGHSEGRLALRPRHAALLTLDEQAWNYGIACRPPLNLAAKDILKI